MRNNRGPMQDPCGTPLRTSRQSDTDSPRTLLLIREKGLDPLTNFLIETEGAKLVKKKRVTDLVECFCKVKQDFC